MFALAAALTIASSTQASQPAPKHWAQTLVERVAQIDAAIPIVDRVVLVPDAATWLDEVGRWTPRGRWPVLIDDGVAAAAFVRAFAPAQLLRREPVGGPPPRGDALRAAIERVVARAWTIDDAAPATPSAAFARAGLRPVGVVVASADDPAWTAATALAAGRGQPIVWLDDRFGAPSDTLDATRGKALRDAIAERLDALEAEPLGLAWRGMGDDIEAVTLCRTVAGRLAAATAAAPAGESGGSAASLAMTDLIGRLPDDSRGAYAGWIFGDEARSAWAAMCSLFLPRRAALLGSAYGTEPPWDAFDVAPAADRLSRAGIESRTIAGPAFDLEGWRRLVERGVAADLLFLNSSGNADFFTLHANRRVRPGAMPVFVRPAAVQVVHSWSLAAPQRATTIGGRLLRNGAFAYVGSVEEPFLTAFLPPALVAERLLAGVPLLVAARHWDTAKPWRVQTIGDPLMMLLEPARDPRRRIAPADDHGAGTDRIDLRVRVKEAMRKAAAERDDDAAAEAIAILDLLSEESVAIEFWRSGRSAGFAGPSSDEAIQPLLFRLGRAEELVEACETAPPADPIVRDMIWSLLPLRASPATAQRIAIVLERAIRAGGAEDDVVALHGFLRERVGSDAAAAALPRLLGALPDDAARRRVRERTR